jgi:large subunit ribosomal protein L9
MQIILLENVRNLGKFGSKVEVAKGFGRNYLIPQGKAVPATRDNIAQFEGQRAELEKKVHDRLAAAEARAIVLNQADITIVARAAEEGKLYGSIGTVELVRAFKDKGIAVTRQEIRLPNGPFREVGEFVIELHLHAEVVAKAKVTILAEEGTR